MKLRIHRGAHEIGGNCIELHASGKSILLDLGAPLSGDGPLDEAVPRVPGLQDGSNPNLLGIVISHPHADHYGLVSFAHPSIPIFIGKDADILLRASSAFSPFGVNFPDARHYRHKVSFNIGPFWITPYLNDHSAFDAYSFLIEANKTRIFYSGDIRGHGWKARLFEQLLRQAPRNVDVMLLEGTTLSRKDDERAETEAELVNRLKESIGRTHGLVLAAFAGQNIDRFVSFFKATKAVKRGFVADVYLAHLLRKLNRQSLPDPTSGALRIYLPKAIKQKIIREKLFDVVEPFRSRRIYPNELRRRRKHLVINFRGSMADELASAGCLEGAKLIFSMWPGYLSRGKPDLNDWCKQRGVELEIIHTSGHADAHDLCRLVSAITPKTLIPIHTLAPEQFHQFSDHVTRLRDGEWYEP